MLIERNNLQYTGAEHKVSLYDVIYPESGANLPLVLFCHGFKGFKDWGHFPLLCRTISEAGYVVVKLNFSHNGIGKENVEEFTELEAFSENNYLKELDDLDGIIEELKKDPALVSVANMNSIHLVGHSRGGSISILKASKDKRIKSVVSWAAVADLHERLGKQDEIEDWRREGVRIIPNARTGQNMPVKYQFVEVLLENKKTLSVERAAKKLAKPFLVVHGENDPTVGLEHAYALQVWNPKAELVTIDNADHVFNGKHPYTDKKLPFESDQLVSATINFLKNQ